MTRFFLRSPWPLLLVAACGGSTDGARWDTATDARPSTTATTPPADTAATSPPTSPTDPGLCSGEGPAMMMLGTGPRSTFQALASGDDVALEPVPSGAIGVTLSVLTEGMDTRAPMFGVMDVSAGGIDDVYVTELVLRCPDSGPGWVELPVPIPDDAQPAAQAGDLGGTPLDLAFRLTDDAGEQAEVNLSLRMVGP